MDQAGLVTITNPAWSIAKLLLNQADLKRTSVPVSTTRSADLLRSFKTPALSSEIAAPFFTRWFSWALLVQLSGDM